MKEAGMGASLFWLLFHDKISIFSLYKKINMFLDLYSENDLFDLQ